MKFKVTHVIMASILLLAVAAGVSRQPFYAAGPTLIQSGTIKQDTAGKATNSFTITYSSAPQVFLQRAMNAFSPSNCSSVTITTTSNFVADTGESGTTNRWIAVGTP